LAVKEFNRSSIFTGALLVLALLALLPGRSSMADEWNEVSQRDARISLGASALGQAIEYHARRKVRYGIAEIGSWRARSGGFPRAEVYAQILQHNARFTSKFDLKDEAEDWNFLKGEELEFGAQKTYWNSLGQGKYRSFGFRDHECVMYLQFWGMTAETRGVDAGTRMLSGYYCNPAGHSLSDEAIANVLASLRVISSGKLTAATTATNSSQITEDFDGRWIIEVKDVSSPFDVDRQVIRILDHRFSVRVEFNGWRGTVSGEIDRAGRLDGTGSLKATGRKPTQLKFSAKVSNETFHVNTTGSEFWGRPPSFTINLKRESEAALSGSNLTPQTAETVNGKWLLEFMEETSPSSADVQLVDVIGNRFSAEVSTNGWRGTVSGEFDKLGNLEGTGRLKRMGHTSRTFKFSAKRSNGTFRSNTVINAQSGSVTTITINLTRH
jgi:hypothetical protein